MSVPAPNLAPAPSGAPSGSPAAYPAAPGFLDPGDPYSGVAGDRFGYAPVAPSASPNAERAFFPGTEYVDVGAIFSGGRYNSPDPITNPIAKVALWLAVAGVFLIPIPISVVLAIIGLVRAQDLPDRIGTHEAVAALIFDGILVAVGGIIYALGL